MAAEIISINPQNFESQTYEATDTNLIPTFNINTSLNSGSYIEYYVYDLNQNLLSTNYNFTQYKVLNDGQSAGTGVLSQIELNPEEDLIQIGYNQGSYITYYNFLNKQIGSNLEQLYISEISSDRTEIRLDSTSLTNADIVEKTTAFINERENSEYFLDFYLNFGDNLLYIANNIALDNDDPNNPTILIKLYEALPSNFDINSTLWVVSSVEEPIAYQVNFIEEPIVFDDTIKIKGPNFNIDLKDQVNNSTQELSYTDLVSTSLTSSQNQLNSLLEEKEIDINVDYTNFEDFIHFSSAQTRLENFYYKISLIEQYSSSISILNNTTSSSLAVSQSTAVYESQINDIITNFDGWDYYLYYSSGSWAWPKLNTEPPYQLASTGSVSVLNWLGSTNEYSPLYGGIILSSSLYDNNNKDNLLFSIPEYLREDPSNEPYELFIDMVAQHFDNIWIYYKDVTQKYNADNRLEYGISKDIVADAIRNFGIKLYQNNFSNQDLYTAFLGLTPEGGLFPFPNITGSLPTPSGFEYVDTLISASNDYLPLDDVNKSLYKRIYHNLPYLLKSKGTLPGLRALITSYGIPDTVLRINEYGGKDKVDSNDWDYWQDEFNYAYSTEGDNFISSSWALNSNWNSPDDVPSTLTFRFKSPELPHSNIRYSQSLWSNDLGSTIVLTYTGSAYVSSSYSGSIIDPYYQYATLTFYPDITEPTTSSNVYLPFYDGGWWSVMVNRDGSDFTLHASNKIYEGGDNGTILGFYQTSSITGNDTPWINSVNSYFPISFSIGTVGSYYDVVTYDNTAIYDNTGSLVGIYSPFSGSYQEIRYYNTVISSDVFKDYTMNPHSIEGNSLNSSPNELAFRASIGGELYTSSISCHPKIAGSWETTHSFASDSNFYYDITPNFVVNREYFFYDQPIAGIKNAVSDKIRLENDILPSGDTLSPFRRLSQTTEASASYTEGTNLLEVAFSPQDEINDDINSQIGYFNIGDFIGDPAFRSSHLNSYPDLDKLRNEYFEKYTKNYNLVDFIRLIKFFDNSLFKMIRDFVPARTSLASGVVIKQTLLERNRYPQPQVSWEDLDISGTIKPQWNDYNPGTIENFSGGTAGTFEQFNSILNVSQSWTESYPTLSGSALVIHSSQDEFYDGEFSGSIITVTTQSLNPPYPVNIQAFEYSPIVYKNTLYDKTVNSTFTEGQFLNPLTSPDQGEILFLIPRFSISPFVRYKAYVKINKFDCNGVDNTIPLGQLTTFLIKYSTDTTYTTFDILNISEYSTYYLYEVNKSHISLTGNEIDNYIKDYHISASRTTPSFTLTPGNNSAIQSLTESIDNLNYFTPTNGVLTFSDTPNIPITITASLSLNSSANNNTGSIVLIKNGDVTDEYAGSTELSQTFILSLGSNTVTFTGSFIPLNGDTYYLRLYNDTNPFDTANITFNSIQLTYTQSVSPTASVCDSVIFEPYIITPNFYNSDENALINNVEDERLSTQYQDVDYSTGALIPTNFNLLIEGNAQKAPVQDSNYSTLRHINPRYNGSRTTSQELNVWSENDEGTYGKLPTIDSNKVYVAYCDYIGGWPPERMQASGAHILYLIKEDGTIIIPNTSENSLQINKGTFESGERISISSKNSSTNGETNYRTIIRGGTRIEPILYNQIGHTPALWAASMSLTDINQIGSGSVIADYTALTKPSTYYPHIDGTAIPFKGSQIVSKGVDTTVGTTVNDDELYNPGSGYYQYQVTSDVINEGVTLIIKGYLEITNLQTSNTGIPRLFIQLMRKRGSNTVAINSQIISALDPDGFIPPGTQYYPFTISASVSPTDYALGDLYYLQTKANGNASSFLYIESTSRFQVLQSPTPTTVITSSGLWQYNASLGTNKLYTTQSTLVNNFNTSQTIMENISGSGFNSVVLPWGIKYGDEFRFEGREDRVWMVKNAYVVSESVAAPSDPSIIVEFDRDILSSSLLNYNRFLIRRYTNDASLILFEGYKPTGAEGPFLIKPEFCSPALNKSIDQFITDLTQKGLIT